MWLLVGCLVLFVLAVASSSAFVFVRTREFLGVLRGFSTAADTALEPLHAGTARLSEGPSPAAIAPSVARLRASQARLAVLVAALADVRAAVGRIIAFVPRK
jgi:hypothetical protein